MKTARFAITLFLAFLTLDACAQQSSEKLKVAILLFQDVQTIDYAAPYEVFGPYLFDTYTVGPTTDPVGTVQGMQVVPQYDFDTAPLPDILVVPGGGKHYPDNKGPYGMGLPFADNPAIIAWIQKAAGHAQYVLSICNGAFALGKAGLLDGLEATTTANLIPYLQQAATKTRVRDDRRFVDNGKIVTSAGLTAGIDASLHVFEKVFGRGKAEEHALGLEYRWDPEGTWTRPQLADRYMRFSFTGFDDAAWSVLSRKGDLTHWENRWSVRMPDTAEAQTAAEIRALFDRTIEQNKTWKPMDVTWQRADQPKPSDTASEWTFVDPDGNTWKGMVTVTADPKGDGRHIISLSVHEAAAGS